MRYPFFHEIWKLSFGGHPEAIAGTLGWQFFTYLYLATVILWILMKEIFYMQLEKMKRENSDCQDDGTCELLSVDLQREMMQLDKVSI